MSDFFLNLESLLSCHFAFFFLFISSFQVGTFKPKLSCVQVAGRHAAVSPDCAAGLLCLVGCCCVVSCVVAVFRMVMAPFCAQLRTLFASCVSAEKCRLRLFAYCIGVPALMLRILRVHPLLLRCCLLVCPLSLSLMPCVCMAHPFFR